MLEALLEHDQYTRDGVACSRGGCSLHNLFFVGTPVLETASASGSVVSVSHDLVYSLSVVLL